MKVFTENRIPAKMWLETIEPGAMDQVKDLTSLPFAFHHVAIMPDAHEGIGMPIGGVLATDAVVVPNAVGVDISCGMCAIKSNLKASEMDREKLTSIMRIIRARIPLGMDHHKDLQDEALLPQGFEVEKMKVVSAQQIAARHQVGTLGGGNHFIEIQKDTEDNVWVMIHSGSRNLGFKVAKFYADRAKWFNDKYYSQTVKGLEFLPIEEPTARAYFDEMKYCIEFAFCNRSLMMNRICESIVEVMPDAQFEPMINIAHNYAAWEHHFGKNVIVHRKGATRAYEGEIGIIPGSQGTASYIVRGLGNPESFMSCSHGAGRVLGRKQAIDTLDLQTEINKLNAQGIIHAIRSKDDLQEAAGAYKDIEDVMYQQRDLVEPIVKLHPMAVIKG